ncbi:magnesium and cobalt transport protein CorA [Kocuria palustris]|uniref:magnesium and cobalt transport protein CorA n=1 Tax=Kocuria palustris TaxID=71999 RepID=UPI00195EFC57|nr:magnesium and cobalt transport protein CorA [Kocuria palustris]MBM7823605.1 magnesium transporter [Kocuria palustris]
MPLQHCAVYRDGRLLASPSSIREGARLLDDSPEHDGSFIWIALESPTREEFDQLQGRFELHDLAVEDSLQAHQRPKVERYGPDMFTVLRPAVYDDAQEQIRIGEIHVFLGTDYAVTVRYEPSEVLRRAARRLEDDPKLLARGPAAVHYAVVDQMVDDYFPVLQGVSADLDQIEDDLLAGEDRVSPRIYSLARQVTGFHRACEPLEGMLGQVARAERVRDDETLRHLLRDVSDHAVSVTRRVESLRAALNDAMQLDATLTAARQNDAAMQLNDQTKRISSWAAILVVPTLIAGIYGMNFDDMPELHWALGYPYSLGLMALCSLVLYLVFKRKDWL